MSAELERSKDVFQLYARHGGAAKSKSLSPRKVPTSNKLKDLQAEEGDFEHLYLRQSNPEALKQRKKRVDQGLEKAKFNYTRYKKERLRRWMQMTGLNKHARGKVDK